MKLLTFSTPENTTLRLGIKTDQGIVDVAQTAVAHNLPAPADINAAITAPASQLEAVANTATDLINEDTVTFGPCLTNPEKIICIGLNYRKHAEETGAAIPTTPVAFSKFNNTLAAHGENIPMVAGNHKYDYEVELGVVIGREARNVAEEDALDYVFGYCTINDVSVRDLQMRSSQWLLGKTIDKGLPIGPYLVTADEVADPHDLRLTTHVNGELRQDSNSNDLIFNINQIIADLSQFFTLKPGDIISTGTPSGVILGMAEPVWLKDGDEVTVEVEGLGRCTNRFVDQPIHTPTN